MDLQTILAPIPGDLPVGTDPRGDFSPTSTYLALKDMRGSARRKERALDVDPDGATPDSEWSSVAQMAETILTTVGKDLEVASWLIEAKTRREGFAGLTQGVLIAAGLVDQYWDELFPAIDNGDIEPRILPFTVLNGATSDGVLFQPIRKIPVTAGTPSFAYWQYEAAKNTAAKDSGSPDRSLMDEFTAAVNSSPASFFQRAIADIESGMAAIDQLAKAFQARVGADAPPLSGLEHLLEEIRDSINIFAADKLSMAIPAGADSVSGAGDASAGGPNAALAVSVGSGQGPIKSREDALSRLLEIARYFRANEPQSTLSYTIEDAVRRARIPLNELLGELIADDTARRQFFVSAGIRPPSDAPPDVPSEGTNGSG
jgi:type VI secretion system protein ImpA